MAALDEKKFRTFLDSRPRQRLNEWRISLNRVAQNSSTIVKHPYLLPAVAKGFFHAGLRQKILRSIELSIGYECNFKCNQCSCRLSYDRSRTRLTLDEFKKLADDAVRLGVVQFNLTGGEPLLHEKDVFELIHYINKEQRRYVHLCTNGYLLNEEKVNRLVAAGLCSLEMGLDSAYPEEHDANRKGKGSYDRIMTIAGYARRAHMPVILNTIITHAKVASGEMLELARLAKEKGVRLQITVPCLTGAWKGRPDILLTEQEKKYLRWLLRFPHVRMDTYSSFRGVRCSAGREKVAITPYGDVLPCSLVQIPYGNVRQASLEAIWEKMYQQPEYHRRLQACPTSFDPEFIKKYHLDEPTPTPITVTPSAP